jgi:hypothetical protein
MRRFIVPMATILAGALAAAASPALSGTGVVKVLVMLR